MRKNITLSFFLLMLLATACQNTALQPTSTSRLPIPTKKATATKPAIRPKSTATHPSPFVPVATVATHFSKSCFSFNKKEIPIAEVAHGTMLSFEENVTFMHDLQTGKQYKLPDEKNTYITADVSPDHKKLAYLQSFLGIDDRVTKEILSIFDAHGDLLAKATFDSLRLYHLRWLDNERLLFYIDETSHTSRVLEVNPFKHEQHYIWNDLPGFYGRDDEWWTKWLVEYSPDLQWVVYYGTYDDGLPVTNGNVPVVRDIKDSKTIWKSADYNDVSWSPDGSQLAVASFYQDAEWMANLYIVNHNGVAKPILPHGQNLPKNNPVYPVWSPDGEKLAFWNNDNLMIYDQQTDQVNDPCLNVPERTVQGRPSTLWSPDGTQILIHGFNMLVDLQKQVIYNHIQYPSSTWDDSYWMNSLP